MSEIPLLDSDVKTAIELTEFFREKARHHSRLDRGRFDAEIVDRFAAHNIAVEVKWEQAVDPGEDHTMQAYVPRDDDVLFPTIEIQGLVRRVEFDHEQMAYEVTHDVLGLGEEASSVIKTGTADEARLIKGVERAHKHSHGGYGDHDHSQGDQGHRH